jgi:putative effector of murein hydrolase
LNKQPKKWTPVQTSLFVTLAVFWGAFQVLQWVAFPAPLWYPILFGMIWLLLVISGYLNYRYHAGSLKKFGKNPPSQL